MATFTEAVHELGEDAARDLQLLAHHPGGHLDAGAAAAMLKVGTEKASRRLESLTDASLLEEIPDGRYRFHEPIRVQARELPGLDDAERDAAVARVLVYLLQNAALADYQLLPSRARHSGVFLRAIQELNAFRSPGTAMAWLDNNIDNLVGAQQAAVDRGRYDLACQLGETTWGWLQSRNPHPLWERICQVSIEAASECGDMIAEARMTDLLAHGHRCSGDDTAAWAAVERMLDLAEISGDRTIRVSALEQSSLLHLKAGAYDLAAEALHEALEILAQLGGHLRWAALIHRNLGMTSGAAGAFERARDHYEIAFRMFADLRDGPDRHQQGRTLVERAQTELDADAPRQAISKLNEAIHYLDDSLRPLSLAHAYRLLAMAYEQQGENERARQACAEAMNIYQDADVDASDNFHRQTLEIAARLEMTRGS